MAHYQFKVEQFLKTDLETIWDFASSPKNLKEITPICIQKILDNI